MIYFAYGANLCRAHMALWCPHSEPLVAAELSDHRLVFRVWADVVPSPGDRVPGALYEVADEDRASLEEFEDCPGLCGCLGVQVLTSQGPVDAVTYRMHGARPFAPPSLEYLALIEQGYEDWRLDPGLIPVKVAV